MYLVKKKCILNAKHKIDILHFYIFTLNAFILVHIFVYYQ